MSKLKIILVDDHALIRDGVELLLSEHPKYALESTFSSAAEVQAYLAHKVVDIVILDLQLPDRSGLNLIADFVGSEDMTVIVLTGQEDANAFEQALQLGARGVVSKADPIQTIVDALDYALAGEVYLSPNVSEALRSQDASISLSPRQSAILRYLSEGCSLKEIAYRLKISVPTVSFHLRELRNKLGVAANRLILPKALDIGLVRPDL